MSADEIVAAARRWVGTPYRHRTSTMGAGCDCLGLIRGVWRELYGVEPEAVPNYRAGWRGIEGGELEAAAERLMSRVPGAPAAGQVVLFALSGRTARHCGITVSADRFVHAQERLGVVEANLTDGWRQRIAGVFAFPRKDLE